MGARSRPRFARPTKTTFGETPTILAELERRQVLSPSDLPLFHVIRSDCAPILTNSPTTRRIDHKRELHEDLQVLRSRQRTPHPRAVVDRLRQRSARDYHCSRDPRATDRYGDD